MRRPATIRINKAEAVFWANKRITQTLAEFQLIVGYRHCGVHALSLTIPDDKGELVEAGVGPEAAY